MTIVSPYIETWSTTTAFSGFLDAYNKGIKSATFAFVVADSQNQITSDFTNAAADMKAAVAAGMNLTISLGGASGSYLDSVMTVSQFTSALESIIAQTGTYNFDFDVEMGYSGNMDTVRNTSLVALQKKYPQMKVSFTLAADTSGFPASSGLLVLQNAVSAGVNITYVCGMLFDNSWTASAISSNTLLGAEAIVAQLKVLYPNKTSAQLYGMLIITPMIGQPDNGSPFLLSDATNITNYAIKNKIGGISYWNGNRDQTGTGDYGSYSNYNTSNLQYYNIFKAAISGSITTTVVTPVTPVVTPTPVITKEISCDFCRICWKTSSTACSLRAGYEIVPNTTTTTTPTTTTTTGTIASWSVGVSYKVGDKVSYNGKTYVCIQAHTSQSDWNPSAVASLWTPV